MHATRLALAVALAVAGTAGVAAAQSRAVPQTPALPATAPAGPSLIATVVDQVVALFPKVEGEVLEVQGGSATLDVGQSGGMRVGLTVSLVRPGREIKHPKSGQFLGRVEEPVGRAIVSQVQPGFAFAQVFEGGPVGAGDRFRVAGDRVPLAVLSISEGVRDNLAEAATQELLDRLNASARFRVVLGDSGRLLLEQRGIGPEALLAGHGVRDVAERLKVEHLVAVYFKRVQGRPYMDVRLFSPPWTSPLVASDFFVPPSVRAAVSGTRFSAGGGANPPQTRPRSLLARLLGGDVDPNTYSSGESTIPLREIAKFPFPVVALDISIGPKDKIPRIAVSDSWSVYVYKIANQRLELDWSLGVRRLGRVLSIQLADLDGDGVLELVGNRYDTRGGLNAFIATVKDGAPRIAVDDVNEFLYAVDTKGEGVKQTLWSQRFSPETFFRPGQAEILSWRDRKLVSEKAVRVPPRFRPMGATFSNISGKDTRALVYIDEFNHLQIAADAEELWTSTTAVGGGLAIAEIVVFEGRDQRSRFYKIEPSPLAVDLDGDGIEEIVVPQNTVKPGLLAVVFKGPAGYRLQSIDTGFEGNITGLGAFRNSEDTMPTVIAAVVRYTNFLKVSGETQIIMTVPQE